MPPDALEVADKLFSGELAIEEVHPFSFTGDLTEVASNISFLPSFANVVPIVTDEGLALVDTGSVVFARSNFDQIRAWRDDPLHTAIYTHGHIDHVFGLGPFEEEAAGAGRPRPRVVAHEGVVARFDRYRATAGYNGEINRRQFQLDSLEWPTEYRYPDETYADELELDVGGTTLKLRHGKGETDDHTWVWIERERVLCCGDFFIWATPNAGNPQKVQRYPAEWAQALRDMSAQGADVLLPGHGLPVVGRERVRQVLDDAAELLESLVAQTLEQMNAGATLDDTVHNVAAPSHLLERPYLKPIYDEPEFIVRNVWRLYAGWFDGDPAELKPAPLSALGAEIASLAGGAQRLAARARELAEAGDLRVASHLVELARAAAPDDPSVLSANAVVYSTRAETEASTMSKGIFSWAARRSQDGGRV